jgi:hypothetical protein
VRSRPNTEDGLARDEEGDELEDPSMLAKRVLDTARDLMRGTRLHTFPDGRFLEPTCPYGAAHCPQRGPSNDLHVGHQV